MRTTFADIVWCSFVAWEKTASTSSDCHADTAHSAVLQEAPQANLHPGVAKIRSCRKRSAQHQP